MTGSMIQEFTAKGWILRPLNASDDLDELDRADFENLCDQLADQQACSIFGGTPIQQETTPTQIALF